MHIREVLLRLNQANIGMLECLLGPGGTLEALSIALSRIDSVQDANAQVLYVRNYAGMPPLPSIGESVDSAPLAGSDGEVEAVPPSENLLTTRPISASDKKMAAVVRARKTTESEILSLPEDGVEKVFEGGRDGMNEGVRIVQEICCCLGEVLQ